MLKVGIICLVITGTAGAQAIVQQGVAAASGTLAGALAGKTVSDALDSTRKAAESAARTGAPKTVKAASTHAKTSNTQAKGVASGSSGPSGPVEAMPVASGEAMDGGARHGGVSRSPARSRRVRSRRNPASNTPILPLLGSVQESRRMVAAKPEPVTAERVKRIEVGDTMPVVLSRLGKPASTILIPEQGGLRQVLYYTNDGDMVGAVDLSPAGSVDAVRVKN